MRRLGGAPAALALVSAAWLGGCGQINGFAVSGGAQEDYYVFLGNFGASTISVFQLSGGQLSAVASPVATGQSTTSVSGMMVLSSPSGAYLYAAERGSSDISQFAFTPPDLSLTPPRAASLTASSSDPVTAGAGVSQLVANPSFTYAYASDSTATGNNVSLYSMASPASGGALTYLGDIAAKTGPSSLVVDPSGSYLYVANTTSANITEYTLGSNGVPTVMAASPVAAGETGPDWIITDPAGKFVYVTCSSNAVAVFSIGSGGGLTAAGTYPTGANPTSIALTASGAYAYVSNSSANSVSAYSVNAGTGALTAVPGSPFALPGTATIPYAVAVDPSGQYVLTANQGSGDITVFQIDSSTGALSVVPQGTPVPGSTSTYPQSLAFAAMKQSL